MAVRWREKARLGVASPRPEYQLFPVVTGFSGAQGRSGPDQKNVSDYYENFSLLTVLDGAKPA